MQNDVSGLLSQLKDMQNKNSELADENKILILKVFIYLSSILRGISFLTDMVGSS